MQRRTRLQQGVMPLQQALSYVHNSQFLGLTGKALGANWLRFLRETDLLGRGNLDTLSASNALAEALGGAPDMDFNTLARLLGGIVRGHAGRNGRQALQELLEDRVLPLLSAPRHWSQPPQLLYDPEVLAVLWQNTSTITQLCEPDSSVADISELLLRLGIFTEDKKQVAATVFAAAAANGRPRSGSGGGGSGSRNERLATAALREIDIAEGLVALAVQCFAPPRPEAAAAASALATLMHRIDEGRLRAVFAAYGSGRTSVSYGTCVPFIVPDVGTRPVLEHDAFIWLCRDAGLLNTRLSYHAALKLARCYAPRGCSSVEDFVALLGATAVAVYRQQSATPTIQHAGLLQPELLWQLLSERILPLFKCCSGRERSDSHGSGSSSLALRQVLQPFLLPASLDATGKHLPALLHLFSRYSGGEKPQPSNSSNWEEATLPTNTAVTAEEFAEDTAVMDIGAFLEVCRTFNLVPALLTEAAAVEVFGAVAGGGRSSSGSAGSGGTSPAEPAFGAAAASFPQFLDCLFVSAFAIFGRNSAGAGDGGSCAGAEHFDSLLLAMDPEGDIFVHARGACKVDGGNYSSVISGSVLGESAAQGDGVPALDDRASSIDVAAAPGGSSGFSLSPKAEAPPAPSPLHHLEGAAARGSRIRGERFEENGGFAAASSAFGDSIMSAASTPDRRHFAATTEADWAVAAAGAAASGSLPTVLTRRQQLDSALDIIFVHFADAEEDSVDDREPVVSCAGFLRVCRSAGFLRRGNRVSLPRAAELWCAGGSGKPGGVTAFCAAFRAAAATAAAAALLTSEEEEAAALAAALPLAAAADNGTLHRAEKAAAALCAAEGLAGEIELFSVATIAALAEREIAARALFCLLEARVRRQAAVSASAAAAEAAVPELTPRSLSTVSASSSFRVLRSENPASAAPAVPAAGHLFLPPFPWCVAREKGLALPREAVMALAAACGLPFEAIDTMLLATLQHTCSASKQREFHYAGFQEFICRCAAWKRDAVFGNPHPSAVEVSASTPKAKDALKGKMPPWRGGGAVNASNRRGSVNSSSSSSNDVSGTHSGTSRARRGSTTSASRYGTAVGGGSRGAENSSGSQRGSALRRNVPGQSGQENNWRRASLLSATENTLNGEMRLRRQQSRAQRPSLGKCVTELLSALEVAEVLPFWGSSRVVVGLYGGDSDVSATELVQLLCRPPASSEAEGRPPLSSWDIGGVLKLLRDCSVLSNSLSFQDALPLLRAGAVAASTAASSGNRRPEPTAVASAVRATGASARSIGSGNSNSSHALTESQLEEGLRRVAMVWAGSAGGHRSVEMAGGSHGEASSGPLRQLLVERLLPMVCAARAGLAGATTMVKQSNSPFDSQTVALLCAHDVALWHIFARFGDADSGSNSFRSSVKHTSPQSALPAGNGAVATAATSFASSSGRRRRPWRAPPRGDHKVRMGAGALSRFASDFEVIPAVLTEEAELLALAERCRVSVMGEGEAAESQQLLSLNYSEFCELLLRCAALYRQRSGGGSSEEAENGVSHGCDPATAAAAAAAAATVSLPLDSGDVISVLSGSTDRANGAVTAANGPVDGRISRDDGGAPIFSRRLPLPPVDAPWHASAVDLAAFLRLIDGEKGIFFHVSKDLDMPPEVAASLRARGPSKSSAGHATAAAEPGDGNSFDANAKLMEASPSSPVEISGADLPAAAFAAVAKDAGATLVPGIDNKDVAGAANPASTSSEREILAIVGRHYARQLAEATSPPWISSADAGTTDAGVPSIPPCLVSNSEALDRFIAAAVSGGDNVSGGGGGSNDMALGSLTPAQLTRLAVDVGLNFTEISALRALFMRCSTNSSRRRAIAADNATKAAVMEEPVSADDREVGAALYGDDSTGGLDGRSISPRGLLRAAEELGLVASGLSLFDIGMTYHRCAAEDEDGSGGCGGGSDRSSRGNSGNEAGFDAFASMLRDLSELVCVDADGSLVAIRGSGGGSRPCSVAMLLQQVASPLRLPPLPVVGRVATACQASASAEEEVFGIEPLFACGSFSGTIRRVFAGAAAATAASSGEACSSGAAVADDGGGDDGAGRRKKASFTAVLALLSEARLVPIMFGAKEVHGMLREAAATAGDEEEAEAAQADSMYLAHFEYMICLMAARLLPDAEENACGGKYSDHNGGGDNCGHGDDHLAAPTILPLAARFEMLMRALDGERVPPTVALPSHGARRDSDDGGGGIGSHAAPAAAHSSHSGSQSESEGACVAEGTCGGGSGGGGAPAVEADGTLLFEELLEAGVVMLLDRYRPQWHVVFLRYAQHQTGWVEPLLTLAGAQAFARDFTVLQPLWRERGSLLERIFATSIGPRSGSAALCFPDFLEEFVGRLAHAAYSGAGGSADVGLGQRLLWLLSRLNEDACVSEVAFDGAEALLAPS